MNTRKPDERIKTGRIGEHLAKEYLLKLNYRILHQNWRCRTGEIDIIAETDYTLIFVEVRTRKHAGNFGTPEESVNLRKQNKVKSTAQVYLQYTGKHDHSIRFDVITVKPHGETIEWELDHIINAF